MHGKVGRGSGAGQQREGDIVSPGVGKRTLVQQIASPAASPPDPSRIQADGAVVPPKTTPGVSINPVSGLPRLQLKGIAARAPVAGDSTVVQRKAQGGVAAHHLRKGNTFTVIDMTGHTADQISAVRAYVDTLPARGIIRVGF